MIDVKTLPTDELDRLIIDAAQERANRSHAFPEEPPTGTHRMTTNPRWWADVASANVMFRILDLGCGWLNYSFNKAEAALLMTYLMRVLTGGHLDAVAANPSAPAPPAGPTARGGGTVH
jgi:hypothetical protein